MGEKEYMLILSVACSIFMGALINDSHAKLLKYLINYQFQFLAAASVSYGKLENKNVINILMEYFENLDLWMDK